MAVMTSDETIKLLRDIESRSRRFAAGLPQQVEAKQFWEGVLFLSSGIHSIAPLSEVKEILNYPPAVTSVPGTKPWMLGVANIRGNLLPLIDMQLYLGGEPTKIGRRSRVLVIDHQGLYAGLLVGDVRGIRHLTDEQGAPVPALPDSVRQYIQRAYKLEGAVWSVFSMGMLAENSDFRVAAI
ncbi:MAG: chemotaxis protein CheW [Candidatus Sedimenticola sp. (ex Thyasira tokunagai)]